MRFPLLPVLIMRTLDSASNARRAFSAGAAGFIPKSSRAMQVIEALREVLAGGLYLPSNMDVGAKWGPGSSLNPEPQAGSLTVRQIEVLTFLCQGKGNKMIAADFGLSEKTVKTHLSAIFKALRVVNRTQAVLAARRLGLFLG